MATGTQNSNQLQGELFASKSSFAHPLWLPAILAVLGLLAYSLPRSESSIEHTWIERRDLALNDLRDAINQRYGFLNGGARINQGPCAAFAVTFLQEWNQRFHQKASAWAVAAPERPKIFHVLVRLPDGTFFDGGRGVLPDEQFRRLLGTDLLIEVEESDHASLEEHFGHLDREYPRCPAFDLEETRKLISEHLNRLLTRES